MLRIRPPQCSVVALFQQQIFAGFDQHLDDSLNLLRRLFGHRQQFAAVNDQFATHNPDPDTVK